MRLHISEEAERLLLDGRNYLKSKDCKATPSGVASQVLEIFFTKYFEQEKKKLEKTFFDKKAYIRKVLASNSDSDEALSESLKELMTKIRSSRKNSEKTSTSKDPSNRIK